MIEVRLLSAVKLLVFSGTAEFGRETADLILLLLVGGSTSRNFKKFFLVRSMLAFVGFGGLSV